MEESVLGGTMSFLDGLGVFEIILPFLFVFTIIFAILEKTKIFGIEKIDGEEVTRKNLNAMMAFVIAFFVIASSKLVALVNQVASQAFILILMFVLFLMLAGILRKEGEFELDKKWRPALMGVGAFVLALIFLNALGWLEIGTDFLKNNWNSEGVSALILIILIVIFMAWMSHSPSKSKKKEDEGD